MPQQDSIAVVGAGIVGAAVAFALAREGRPVLLVDRAEPGVAGASFGNVGHLAAELVQPLPAPGLLFNFWRQRIGRGGVLDLPPRWLFSHIPWAARFALAAWSRDAHTRLLAPLVRPVLADWRRWLADVGRPDLLGATGHLEIAFGEPARAGLRAAAETFAKYGIPARAATAAELEPLKRAAGAAVAEGLRLDDTGNVVDPLDCVRAFATAAVERGARLQRMEVRRIARRGAGFELQGEGASQACAAVVVCAGVESAALLAPLGVHAPLQAVRGYHIELPAAAPLADCAVVYNDSQLVVTPMRGRLRASSYMEFAEREAPPDAAKLRGLRQRVRSAGYACEAEGAGWVGARPVLPDYLPGIGRAAAVPGLFYAVGHQHIGLTLAPVTGDLLSDLVAGRAPRHFVTGFDLGRFGSPRQRTLSPVQHAGRGEK